MLAVLLAAALQASTAVRSPVIQKDGIVFIRFARALRDAPAQTMREEDQHPGYPAMILAARALGAGRLAGDDLFSWILAARLAAGVCGVLSVAALWLLARRIFDARVAGVAAVLFAALPLVRQNAADTMSDAPHLLFYLAATWMAAEGLERRRAPWFLGAGLASGAAFWIRPEGLVVAAVAAGIVGLFAFSRQGMGLRATATCGAGALAGAAACALPYVLIAGKLTGKQDPMRVLPVALGVAVAVAGVLGLVYVLRRRAKRRAGAPAAAVWMAAAARPVEVAIGALRKLVGEVAHVYYHGLLLPLALALVAPGRLRPQRTPAALILAQALVWVALLFGLYALSGYISNRHVMPLAVLGMPWVGAGTVYMAQKVGGWLNRRGDSEGACRERWVLWVLVALMVAGMAPRALRQLHWQRQELFMAARWVGAQAGPKDRVLSNSVYVDFYAGMDGDRLRKGDALPDLTPARGRMRYRFVVLDCDDDHFEPAWLPALEPHYERVRGAWQQGKHRTIIVLRAASGG